jgi:NADH-quinone oxidoreductase subunit F
LSGHVNKPCCVELPLGVTVRELVDQHGGGVWKGRKAKGCIPGGLSMGFLTEAEFDTRLDFNGPVKSGCLGLGTAAVIVFDETTSIADVLYNSCRFFAHESCGQCTPCREGTGWMMKIMDRVRRGKGRKEDLDILMEVGSNIGIMPGTTICGLADGAGWPVKTALTKFRSEFEELVKQGSTRRLLQVAAAH